MVLDIEQICSISNQAPEVIMNVPQLHVGAGTRIGPLTAFPVWTDAPGGLGISTGRHATLRVSELPGGAEVGKLQVTNTGTKPALLLDGELLEGGRQHRVCAADVVLNPGETQEVATLCVEQGRWSGGADHAHSARRAPLNVRAQLHRGGPTDRQSRVWAGVARYEEMGTRSATRSLVEHLDAGAARRGAAPLPAPLEGQRGVVLGLGGKALLLEVFGTHTLFLRHYRQLVDAALMDVQLLGSSVPAVETPGRAARSLAARTMAVEVDDFKADKHLGELRSSGFSSDSSGRSVSGISVAWPHRPAQIAHLTAWNSLHPYVLAA